MMSNQSDARRQKAQNASDETLLDWQEIALLCEQVESWKALAHSKDVELRECQQQLEATERELKLTNGELCSALVTQKLSLAEAVRLARTILATNKFCRNQSVGAQYSWLRIRHC